MNAPPT
jgi:tubulin polyglutamylase TTLL5